MAEPSENSPRCGITDRRGFSLVEVTLSIVVVGVALIAALSTVGSVTRSRAIELDGATARMLAEDLISEVLQSFYEEQDGAPVFGLEGGEDDTPGPPPDGGPAPPTTRVKFDDVDDFDGWSCSPPMTREGAYLDHRIGWSRSVTVTKLDPVSLIPQSPSAPDAGARLVTVTVTSPGGHATSVTAVATDFSSLARPPTLGWDYVSYVGVELQIGPESASRLRTGSGIVNHRRPVTPTEAGGP